MRVECNKELTKRSEKVSELTGLTEELMGDEMSLVNLLKGLSKNVARVCDVGLARSLTEIFEGLTSHTLATFFDGHGADLHGVFPQRLCHLADARVDRRRSVRIKNLNPAGLPRLPFFLSPRLRKFNAEPFRKLEPFKVAPYSYNVSVHVLFERLLFLFRESCCVET